MREESELLGSCRYLVKSLDKRFVTSKLLAVRLLLQVLSYHSRYFKTCNGLQHQSLNSESAGKRKLSQSVEVEAFESSYLIERKVPCLCDK